MAGKLIPIGDLFSLEKGQLQSTKCTPGEFDFITAGESWKTHNDYDHDCEALVFAAAASGSLGRTHHVSGKFIASDLCFILTPKNDKQYPLNLEFYHFVFNSLRPLIVTATKGGTSKESINQKNFKRYKLPYFELAQQSQWIDKLKNTLVYKSSLDAELDRQQTLIKKLRQQILQDAVEGKLTEDWRKDNSDIEPAKKLLERIVAEKKQLIKCGKITKLKPLPVITEAEKPFKLPKGWQWCRLGDLVLNYEAGKSFKCADRSAMGGEWGIIKTSAITSSDFLENENKFLPNSTHIDCSKKINIGDLIFCRASGSKGLAGKCTIVKDISKNLLLSDKTPRILVSDLISKEYIFFHNESQITQKYYRSLNTGKSTSMNNITKDQLLCKPFPLPPLVEQQVIVEQVEKLFSICDQFETQIIQNLSYANQLMQAALNEAFKQTEGALQTINKVVELKPTKSARIDYYKRTLLAAEIVHQLHKEPTLGHLKLQKIIFLCQKTQNMQLPTNFLQQAAGPYDPRMARSLDKQLKDKKWFSYDREASLKYQPLQEAGSYKADFQKYFQHELDDINHLISLFKTKKSNEMEAIATLYACWEDILNSGVVFSNSALLEKFYNWSEEKRKFSERQLNSVIAWMEQHGIVPKQAKCVM